MDDDESFFLAVFALMTTIAAWRWYLHILRVTVPKRGAFGLRMILAVAPLASLALLLLAIRLGADQQVKENVGYVALFLAAGVTWIATVVMMMPLLGISPRDDVLERNNPAAAFVTASAMVGVTLCSAGANWGRGDTIYTTLGPAALAAVAWVGLWFIAELSGRSFEAVTLDRDVASALRLSGLLLAIGVVLGAAVAGDYHSVEGTLNDFARLGWPAVVLVLIAVVIHRQLRPTPGNPSPTWFSRGLVPMLAYLAIAIVCVRLLGLASQAARK